MPKSIVFLISQCIETISNEIANGPLWLPTLWTLNGLSAWYTDLLLRIKELGKDNPHYFDWSGFTDNKIPKQNGKSHQGCRDQKFGDNHLSSLDVESLLRNLALWSQTALLSKNSDRIFHKNNLWIHFERHNKNRALPFSNSSFNVNFFKFQ